MTNPDNIVRVRARNGGRASVYEANGWAQAYTSGLIDGNGVIQNTPADMNVLVGGSSTNPDTVLAQNPAGYRIALDIVGQQAITITAPASNSRISAIVAYTDDLSLATTQDTVTGSPASCGLIVVNGTAGATPSEPTDNQIRTAITADGATGSQAAYCVIAYITVASGMTAITNNEISINMAKIGAKNIDSSTFGAFSRYVKNSQSYTAWTGAVAQLDSADFSDIGCTYSSSTHKITITRSGIWTLTTMVNTPSSNGEYGSPSIRVNGDSIAAGRAFSVSGNLPASVTVSTTVKLNAGDVVDVYMAGSANQTNSTRVSQMFSGFCALPL